MLNVFLIFLGVVCVLCLWIILYDTTHFEITEYCIRDPRIRKSCRAVVLADLHNKCYGRNNELLLKKIREGNPDMVLVAGDLITAKPGKDPGPALHLIRELARDYPVYYGNGNHEHRLTLYPKVYGSLGDEYAKSLEQCSVTPLVNERRSLEENGICVVGAQIHREYYRRFRVQPMAESYLKDLLGEAPKQEFTILLAHNPDYFPDYAKWGADLVLAGHVHGGVARIPFWNRGVISPAIRFFPKYDGGVFRQGKSTMILSRGLGSHTIPIRFWNPGDLIFLELCGGEGELTVTKNALKKTENVIE